MSERFASLQHALFAGYLTGIAMRHGFTITPDIDEEGNYLNRLKVEAPDPPENVHIYVSIEDPGEAQP